MSCRRVAHELIEFFRFGELDARSAPHLEHLEACMNCRREVGLDRELVHQLRRSLQARVDAHAASPGAWLEIRRRALEPEAPNWRRRLLPALRLAPLGATAVLLLALLAPLGGLSPFRAQPELGTLPPWPGFQEAAVNDPVDPYDGRWWLRYVTPPPPSPPATGRLAAVDPGEDLVGRSVPATGRVQ